MSKNTKKKNGAAANGNAAKVSPEAWPASRVELWPVSKIIPYEKNANTHSEDQIKLIAESMRTDGVTAPILVDENGVIIYGHGRRLAAVRNGYDVYPVVQAMGWPEQRKRAVRLKDNQLARLSAWDMGLLREEAALLKASGYEMPLLGFSDQMTTWLTSGDLILDPDREWGGMPHFDNPDAKAFRSMIVHFHDAEGVEQFAKAIKQNITDKTKFVWYPEMRIKPFVKYAGDKQKPATEGKRK